MSASAMYKRDRKMKEMSLHAKGSQSRKEVGHLPTEQVGWRSPPTHNEQGLLAPQVARPSSAGGEHNGTQIRVMNAFIKKCLRGP